MWIDSITFLHFSVHFYYYVDVPSREPAAHALCSFFSCRMLGQTHSNLKWIRGNQELVFSRTITERKLTQIISRRLASVHLNEKGWKFSILFQFLWLDMECFITSHGLRNVQQVGRQSQRFSSWGKFTCKGAHTKSQSPLTGSHVSVKNISQPGVRHLYPIKL